MLEVDTYGGRALLSLVLPCTLYMGLVMQMAWVWICSVFHLKKNFKVVKTNYCCCLDYETVSKVCQSFSH